VASRPACALILALLLLSCLPLIAAASDGAGLGPNEPGIMDPVLTALLGHEVRIPNTDQSVDGEHQSAVHGTVVREDAFGATSVLGHTITHVASPNDDLRQALAALFAATINQDTASMHAAAEDLQAILLGTTRGRIYDGFAMLNFNRFKDPSIGPESFPPDVVPGEYKMKRVRDTGKTFISPYDGQPRRIWEVDVAMLYYDGQIDADTFLPLFPAEAHPDDTLRVNYRIYSLVQEDFSPTLVMQDKRFAQNTVQFPFKGFDAVWIAVAPGQILNVSVDYPPIRQIRGVYTWGWREHPPRIQFMQPIFEQIDAHTGTVIYDPQGLSYAYRNREDLTLETIADAAPEKKMLTVARAVLEGASPAMIEQWMADPDAGPRGNWIEWADLVKVQTQLSPEAWDLLAQEGVRPGDFGDYNMVSVYMNNEMYGEGPFANEVLGWEQGDVFKVKLINLDHHTHYFRNVDFGTRLHDDILRCCGGGETSFEIMNFKPSYGAPKVAEAQWRAGWGFRPHNNIIQQPQVFSRGSDRVQLKPFTGGEGDTFFGFQHSEQNRRGDFRLDPPPFIIKSEEEPSSDRLRDADGRPGLVIGQHTEGYGVEQFCPEDPFPGFCSKNIAAYNPDGVLNWPPPPLQGVNGNPDHVTELRFPPFLRNPDQGAADAGDIIPPTGAWRPFLWLNPNNGTLFIDPEDKSKGYWADLTFEHGRPVFAGDSIVANIELPRASGQVFYQFDDLFHDNDIFSPHPLFEGLELVDEVQDLRANIRSGLLRVRGRLSKLSTGDHAGWVSVFAGSAGASGCSGSVLGTAQVRSTNGRFVFRRMVPGITSGSAICVQSPVHGFASLTLDQ